MSWQLEDRSINYSDLTPVDFGSTVSGQYTIKRGITV